MPRRGALINRVLWLASAGLVLCVGTVACAKNDSVPPTSASTLVTTTSSPSSTSPQTTPSTSPPAPTSSLTSATTTAAPHPAALAQRQVVTHFFYWYDPATGAHMNKNDPLSLHPPEGRRLDWRDPSWYEAEFADMIDAGIDTAACEFWPGEECSTEGLPIMVAARERLLQEGRTPPKLAMFYDTTPFKDTDLIGLEGKAAFWAEIETFFSLVPQVHWGLIDDRPVIWLYDTEGNNRYDASTFEYVRERFVADFGVDPFIVADRSWVASDPLPIDATYTWGVACLGFQPRDTVAGVGPGYDDHLVPVRYPGTIVPREDGAFCERNLYYALASGKNVLWLETWNEHHEASNINHTAEYGRTYIEITRRYVDMFKRGEIPPKPPGGPFSQVASVQLQAPSEGGADQGLTLLDVGAGGGDGGWESVEAAGLPAWTTVGDATGRYLYFAIADDFAYFDAPVTVDITVQFLDEGGRGAAAGELALEYDDYEPGRKATLMDSYRYKQIAALGSTGQWRSATVRLTGVRFANGQNGGADFRLWAGENQDLTVAGVTVTKVQ